MRPHGLLPTPFRVHAPISSCVTTSRLPPLPPPPRVTAPELRSATFDSSGSILYLSFGSQPTDLGGRVAGTVSSCVGLLDGTTIARLGGESLIQASPACSPLLRNGHVTSM